MGLHGFADAAAVSNTDALEEMVKTEIDRAAPGSSFCQSITAVMRIGRAGTGNRAVMVEYSNSQAKHRSSYRQSRKRPRADPPEVT